MYLRHIFFTEKLSNAHEFIKCCTRHWGIPSTHSCSPPTAEHRVLDMYHGESLTSDQERIVLRFTEDSALCCVLATSAISLGVQLKDVRHVIHWGPPAYLLDYWQQVGRGGRHGKPCKAVMYFFPGCHPNNEVKEYMMASCVSTSCLRRHTLIYLHVEGMEEWNMPTINNGCRVHCEICDNNWELT